MRYVRLVSQVSFFVLFFYLLCITEYRGEPTTNKAVKFFLEADPLVAVVVVLSEHGVPPLLTRLFFLSSLVALLTALFGRFFCGWICPLGAINQFMSMRKKVSKERIRAGIYDKRQRFKYLFLLLLLLATLFHLQLTGIFDPLSLLVRVFALVIFPLIFLLSFTVSTFFLNADIPLVTDISEYTYSLLHRTILPFKQPYFDQAFLIGLLFTLIVLLNRIRPRFWCRYICPLGALLGLLASPSRLKRHVSSACTKCNLCHATCQGAPAAEGATHWNSMECHLCFNCKAVCPEMAVSFSMEWKPVKEIPHKTLLPERRSLIKYAGITIIAAPLLNLEPKKVQSHPHLIRPPGALNEEAFLNRCIRCGECMKVCPTNGLQPTLLEAGWEGIWSPHFNMRLGYCEYFCRMCGYVCPTGAIQPLKEKEKPEIRIGLAFINRNRCLPFAFNIPCIVCEEHCPTPKKAIVFDKTQIVDDEGNTILLKQPRVLPELCIGCGICENKCPVVDQPAIYVTSIGETRSKSNTLLLHSADSPY